MIYQEQHEAFKRLAIQQGLCRMEQLNQALPFASMISPTRIDRWLNALISLPKGFASQRRYVNRFKLGADPEFIFCRDGARADARGFVGFQQGLAFGMDNNGRLVEIRPYPSRSALNVVASILATLRWMAVLHPDTLHFDWVTGAFLYGDGLGGHVHLGRKRPGRDLESKALDVIGDDLLTLRAYPRDQVLRRRQGDDHHQFYGVPGGPDAIRKQIHGYEYRTFPSWLDSPELAFLTITLSKLAVQNPQLTQGYAPLKQEQCLQRIKNFLAYFKDTDDDARLASIMVTKRFPLHVGGDFKGRWGIAVTPIVPPSIQYVPSCIEPDSNDIQEMMTHLLGEKTLTFRIPAPTWQPLGPPEGYKMALSEVNTYQAKGLGELLCDVCCPKTFPHPICNTREYAPPVFFVIPSKLASKLPVGWQKPFGDKFKIHHREYIYSCEASRGHETFAECRRLLLETVLPFWKVGEVKADSWQQWQSGLRVEPARRFAGKVLIGNPALLPVNR